MKWPKLPHLFGLRKTTAGFSAPKPPVARNAAGSKKPVSGKKQTGRQPRAGPKISNKDALVLLGQLEQLAPRERIQLLRERKLTVHDLVDAGVSAAELVPLIPKDYW